MSQDEMKEAVKEAAKEWLNEQYAILGKWTLRAVLSAGVVALMYFILMMSGWSR